MTHDHVVYEYMGAECAKLRQPMRAIFALSRAQLIFLVVTRSRELSREYHVTKHKTPARSNFPLSNFENSGTIQFSSSSSTSRGLCPKNFEKKAHPNGYSKKLKSQHYAKKFENSQGDKKKTWKIINELRGKQKTNVKASFVIGNERIICRRIIAEKFNNYFVSLASNLNYETYNEIPITSFPPFESYMSNSCESSIFMEDCNEQEILGIINDLQNGKASDITIVTIKVARTVISPYLTSLYNSCFASGIFPKVLKISKITPIHKKENKELIENYRPVSTLPVFGKIFEKLIYIAEYIDF